MRNTIKYFQENIYEIQKLVKKTRISITYVYLDMRKIFIFLQLDQIRHQIISNIKIIYLSKYVLIFK